MRHRVLLRALVACATVSLGWVAVNAAPAGANHVTTPTVRDVTMGNLVDNERELHIAVDPNNPNHLAGGANERGGGNSQEWYASTDGGRTWTSGDLPYGTLTVTDVAPSSGLLMSDPAVDFGAGGTIYYSALAHRGGEDPCTLFVTTSTDNGVNWSDPANGVIAVGTTGPTVCNDKEFILVDRANGDNVYAAWTPFGGGNDQELVFARDLGGVGNGFAFSAPIVLSTDAAQNGCLNHGAELAQEADGDIYVAWTTFCNGVGDGADSSVWVARSTDLGQNFGAPVQVATLDNVNPAIAASFRTRSFPSIDVDTATGRAFVVWADYTDSDGGDADILISSAVDNAGWTAPSGVDNEAEADDQFMPWVDVAQGRVHVVYYAHDNETSNHNVFLSHGAVAATPAFTVTQVNSQPTPIGTGFIGDYIAVDVGSDNVVHPAWGDGRAGVGGATDGFTARVDFSPPSVVSATASPNPLPWGQSTTVTATVTGAHGETERFIPVRFTVTSAGTPSVTNGSGTTNTAGQATFVYSNGTAGTDTVAVWADLDEDTTTDAGETTQVSVEWSKHPTSVAYTGPSFVANGQPATLSAVLTDTLLAAPVAGESVTISLGSGGTAQSCSAPTNATGTATCTIASVNQPLGPLPVGAAYAGGTNYLPSSASASVVVFGWKTGGNFVIVDGNDTVGATATFWHDEWYLHNSVSGGPAPTSFKGFSNNPVGPTACGGTWRSGPGNSPPPASGVPQYTAVLVTSKVTKSGNVITGTKPSIAIVRVNPGYAPSPGHPGTAEVIGILC